MLIAATTAAIFLYAIVTFFLIKEVDGDPLISVICLLWPLCLALGITFLLAIIAMVLACLAIGLIFGLLNFMGNLLILLVVGHPTRIEVHQVPIQQKPDQQ